MTLPMTSSDLKGRFRVLKRFHCLCKNAVNYSGLTSCEQLSTVVFDDEDCYVMLLSTVVFDEEDCYVMLLSTVVFDREDCYVSSHLLLYSSRRTVM